MGYCTWFDGHFKLEKPLAPHHLAYLQAFYDVPHVHWDGDLVNQHPDPLREAVGLPLGENGCSFTGHGFLDEYCYPPWSYTGSKETGPAPTDPAYLGKVCPGTPYHHCPWKPNDDGTELFVPGDKPYKYIEWLHFLVDHFLTPWNALLNGKMTWHGEWDHDAGIIIVEHNMITVLEADRPHEHLS